MPLGSGYRKSSRSRLAKPHYFPTLKEWLCCATSPGFARHLDGRNAILARLAQ
jgi:hypothetical protein